MCLCLGPSRLRCWAENLVDFGTGRFKHAVAAWESSMSLMLSVWSFLLSSFV